MSASSTLSGFTLEITAEDPGAELFVINGDLYLVDRGVGHLITKPLDPGIYKVKAKAGQQIAEQHVVLRGPGQRVNIPPLSIPSPAPLADSAKTHEYQQAAAEAQSRIIHLVKGVGSSICLFSREWTSSSKSETVKSANPAAGLSLRDCNQIEIANLETSAVVDAKVPDPWAAITVGVDPGTYILRLTLPWGEAFERTLVAAPGWQTQVFLLVRDFGGAGGASGARLADLPQGSVLMSPSLGFSNADAQLRQTEVARLALSNGRNVLTADLRSILLAKFENPMLGIFGGHLLLLNEDPDLNTLRTVVSNLRRILVVPHPDVEALDLAVGGDGQYAFDILPMLRKSWGLVVGATVDRPQLVPGGSLPERAAADIWSSDPWLTWQVKPPARAHESAFSAASNMDVALWSRMRTRPSSTTRGESPFAAVRERRSTTPPTVPPVWPILPVIPMDQSGIGKLVNALGLPRSTVESMMQNIDSMDFGGETDEE